MQIFVHPTVHLFDSLSEVIRRLEADEAIAFSLVAPLVPHHLGHLKAWIPAKCSGQHLKIKLSHRGTLS